MPFDSPILTAGTWAFTGLFLGAGALSLVPRPTPPAAPQPVAVEVAPEAVVIPKDCTGREKVLQDEIDRLAMAFKVTDMGNQLNEARRIQREGNLSEWPDDVDPVLSPDTFKANLSKALATSGIAEVVQVDCQEFPCIATIKLVVESVIEGSSMHEYQPAVEALEDLGYEGYLGFGMAGGAKVREGERVKMATLAVGPTEDPAINKRSNFRLQKVHESSADLLLEAP